MARIVLTKRHQKKVIKKLDRGKPKVTPRERLWIAQEMVRLAEGVAKTFPPEVK